jgi:spore germination protein YaaH
LLVVPSTRAAVDARKLPLMYAPPIPILMRRIFHTVKPGETLASIARRYGVALEDMRRWNPGAKVAAGQKVAVEVRAKGKPRAKAKPKPYKKAGR